MLKGRRALEGFRDAIDKSQTHQLCCTFETIYSQMLEIKREGSGASLVAQRLRIRLPMQGTRVRALVWEDPTCRGATKPVCHNY